MSCLLTRDRYLSCFHVLALVDNAAKNMSVEILPNVLSIVCLDVFSLPVRVEYFLIHFTALEFGTYLVRRAKTRQLLFKINIVTITKDASCYSQFLLGIGEEAETAQ